MATTPALIANRALRHLGVRGRIATLSTDVTPNGVLCNEFYPDVLVETLKAAPWQCAKQVAALTLVEELADGTTLSAMREWTYSYRVPENCLHPRRVLFAGNRNPNAEQEVPFALYADTVSTAWAIGTTYAINEYASVTTAGVTVWYRALRETVGDAPASSASDWVAVTTVPMLLYTDVEDAVLEYTFALTDTTRFDTDFAEAVSALLAFYIAPTVTVNGSAAQLQATVAAKYDLLVGQALSNDSYARKRDMPPRSGYQTVRSTGVR